MLFTPLARQTFAVLLREDANISFNIRMQLFAQVIAGIGALHETWMCHGDIKPANLGIVSLKTPHAIVLDYGGVIEVGNDKLHGVTATPGRGGTVGYIAPEKEAAQGQYGLPIDIWSLGCVGYQIFNEMPYLPWGHDFNPWRNPSTLATRQRDRAEGLRSRFTDLSNKLRVSSKELDLLLSTMLAEDPDQRPTTDTVLKQKLLLAVQL